MSDDSESGDRPPGRLYTTTMRVAAETIADGDPVMAAVLQTHGPPPLWKRPQTFATFVRIILEQQVSLSSARSTFLRLSQSMPEGVTATRVAAAGQPGLQAVGFSRQKARYAVALADDVIAGRFRIPALRAMPDDHVRRQITDRLGLGDWSAGVYLMMAMLRPDVLPHGDLALVKGLAELDDGVYGDPDELERRTESWRPFRSVGVRMVWQAYLARRNQRFQPT
ncbi:DNA-3-methyladenine glycosylase family protein [Crateriforma conspicua]|uniref:DNA-3-methyladenine glycosylase II n=1 Tax=Crateriforma conspicua TaxID=2527996 RepID=A0A5C5YC17_9PLAN|nr:DNA-3-methyladenine glycosylase [Crateriforma conspicua]TWT72479.1 3-methyl-adenine DNA glycosylase II [Crateriforma conspicua]